MATVEVDSGICGFVTTVRTHASGRTMTVALDSECEHIQSLATALTEVDPFQEISFRGEGPLTLRLAAQHCGHAACPVPVGIIKAIEVEAGLALPRDVTIRVSRD